MSRTNTANTITMTLGQVAKMINHSLLHPTMTEKNVLEGLRIAKKYNVAAACVKPYLTTLAKKELEGTDITICPVMSIDAPVPEQVIAGTRLLPQQRPERDRISKDQTPNLKVPGAEAHGLQEGDVIVSIDATQSVSADLGFREDPLITQALLDLEQAMNCVPEDINGNGMTDFWDQFAESRFRLHEQRWIWNFRG